MIIFFSIFRHDADQETLSGFDYPSDEIKLHCKAMYEAAKAVHKFEEKVNEKQMKSKSKHLEKYKTKYTDNLEALKTEMSFIDNVSMTSIRDLNSSECVFEIILFVTFIA
jgi:predicted NodU family carbamoyl transferase